jgi:serine/threonine-protein kinase
MPPAENAPHDSADDARTPVNAEATRYQESPVDSDGTQYTLPAEIDGTEPSVPLRQIGNYEIQGELARGGMGVVFRAREVHTGRPVALKMILAGQFATASAVARFHSEAKAAANLDHPGIVPIYEVGEIEGKPFFTMPLITGGSLQDLLRDGPLPPELAAGLVR